MSNGEQIGPVTRRVRATHVRGQGVRFYDPDAVINPDGSIARRAGARISREEALGGLRFDFRRNRIVDSFGSIVGRSHLRLPGEGRVAEYFGRQATFRPLYGDPRFYRPQQGEEIIERVRFINRDGTISSVEISYGRGERYDRSRGQGKWTAAAKRASGWKPGDKVDYNALRETVLDREIMVKRWTR